MASAFGLTWPDALLAAEKAVSPPRKPKPPRLLMIDPGHGGRDPGAIGLTGCHEKDVTLDIALRVADALSAKPGVTVKLTRDSDIFLPLEERVRISREARADLFLSIHADSAPNREARGLSVYTLSEKASDDFAKSLAEHENEADLMGGVDLPPPTRMLPQSSSTLRRAAPITPRSTPNPVSCRP
jgi:N-acetylmuramoyl-L-alanine amidase